MKFNQDKSSKYEIVTKNYISLNIFIDFLKVCAS